LPGCENSLTNQHFLLDILFVHEVMGYLSAEAWIFWASAFDKRLSGARKGVAGAQFQTENARPIVEFGHSEATIDAAG
jgi:hypothetical protein